MDRWIINCELIAFCVLVSCCCLLPLLSLCTSNLQTRSRIKMICAGYECIVLLVGIIYLFVVLGYKGFKPDTFV
jgi:hypothetical protein